jgi:hypothetical protein
MPRRLRAHSSRTGRTRRASTSASRRKSYFRLRGTRGPQPRRSRPHADRPRADPPRRHAAAGSATARVAARARPTPRRPREARRERTVSADRTNDPGARAVGAGGSPRRRGAPTARGPHRKHHPRPQTARRQHTLTQPTRRQHTLTQPTRRQHTVTQPTRRQHTVTQHTRRHHNRRRHNRRRPPRDVERPRGAGSFRRRPVSRILSRAAIHLCGLPGPWRVTCKRSCLA